MEKDQIIDENGQKQTDVEFDLSLYDELDDKDKEIIKLKIEFPAISTTSLSKKIGICRSVIYDRLKKEKVKNVLNQYQSDSVKVLLDNQAEAARTIVELMRSDNKKIALGACREILKGVLSEKSEIKMGELKTSKHFDDV